MLVNPKGKMNAKGIVTYAKKAFNAQTAIGGTFGLFAVLTVPRLVKWDTGWKGILVTGATTVVGGYAISKYNKDMAYAFTTVGVAVTALKTFRYIMGSFSGTLGGMGYSPEAIGGLGDFAEFGVGNEEDLFGTGLLEPTFEGI